MEIRLAKEMGFCFGVRKAIELVEKEARAKPNASLTTYGSLVHNPVVNEKMENLGVKVNNRDMKAIGGGTIAFTAHGIAPEVIEEAKEQGLEVMDATCPLVTLIQQSAVEMIKEGYFVIVYGDKKHVEVQSIVAWAASVGSAKNVISTNNFDDVKDLRPPKRIGIVCQSTSILKEFREFVIQVNEHFLGKTKEIKVHNTICAPTTRLQTSAEELARECQVMVVIGGKQSANTQHLADLCREYGATTYKIERAADLEPAWFENVETVGVTAGASTPDESIEEVVAQLRSFDLIKQMK